MPLSAGTRLGPYEVLSPLGAGGMGGVYRARDPRLNRDVALKILPAQLAADPSRRQRFEIEARAVAALSHPNIVAVYDVGEGYIVSELVAGPSRRRNHYFSCPLRGGNRIGPHAGARQPNFDMWGRVSVCQQSRRRSAKSGGRVIVPRRL